MRTNVTLNPASTFYIDSRTLDVEYDSMDGWIERLVPERGACKGGADYAEDLKQIFEDGYIIGVDHVIARLNSAVSGGPATRT